MWLQQPIVQARHFHMFKNILELIPVRSELGLRVQKYGGAFHHGNAILYKPRLTKNREIVA